VGLLPGQLFVHRNVANLVVHTDLNALSVIQYAVDVLGVLHIIVVGHSQCGGVRAALANKRAGLVDNWLRHVADVRDHHAALLASIESEAGRVDALVELNVLEQARNVCQTTIVKDAWARGQTVTVHGWVYGLHNGLLEDLRITATCSEEVQTAFAQGLAAVEKRYLIPSP
jgi:carbonic anhydrase